MPTAFRILLLAAFAIVAGCDRPAPVAPAVVPDAPRIVSLSPAISRTLLDLEMDHLIVGRTPFCDSLDRAIPVVGDLLDLDYERLIRVNPTHVLIQPPASGVNPRLRKLADERGWSLHAWRLDRIEDIGALLADLPNAVFEEHGARGEGLRRAGELLAKMTAFFASADPFEARAPRTLLVVSVEPVTVFGSGTYLNQILFAVGGRNATDVNGYPQFTLEDLARINPEAIVLVSPGRSGDDRAAFGPLARLDIDAVRNDRLYVLGHPDALLPSSAVIEVAEELRELLRPRMNTDEMDG